MTDEIKHPGKLPCGFECSNCRTCILRHYALTQGRCWNCKALLRDDEHLEWGAGI